MYLFICYVVIQIDNSNWYYNSLNIYLNFLLHIILDGSILNMQHEIINYSVILLFIIRQLPYLNHIMGYLERDIFYLKKMVPPYHGLILSITLITYVFSLISWKIPVYNMYCITLGKSILSLLQSVFVV